MNRIVIALLFFLSFAIGCTGNEKLNSDTNEASVAGTSTSESALEIPMTADVIAKGHTIYENTCSPCHGVNGKGDGPAAAAFNPKPRDHSNGAYMDKLSNRHIFNVVRYGGQMYGYPTMPAQPQLSDDQIEQVVAFVRTLSNTYKGPK